NFVALARNIAPDGEVVNFVGFSAVKEGVMRTVSLVAQNVGTAALGPSLAIAALKSPPLKDTGADIQGMLKEADSRDSKRGKIHVIDAEGTSHAVIVPPGMMSDIVKPLWDTE